MTESRPASRQKLLEAAMNEFRARGYAATTVDDLCRAAGVTKGSFFHHFRSKEDLVLAAVAHWNEWTGGLFESAPYQQLTDPRERVLGYLELRAAILDRAVSEFTCLLGTLVQETYDSHPAIRAACDAGLTGHIDMLTRDLTKARARYAPQADWTPESVAYFIQAVLQGSFIFAKAKQGAEITRENIAHLRRYIETLLPKEIAS